jgi:hypothetical protein
MRTKIVVVFRSKSTNFEEGKMEKALVSDLRIVWEPSAVTEEQIQALAYCGLLRPKTEVSWRSGAGEEFPMEGTGETFIFLAHIKRGFTVPVGDFFRGLLFYHIKLVHLVPNSITIISTFIHLCEAYIDIAPHFDLWCHFFELKKTSKSGVVTSVGFILRRNMKSEYADFVFPDNTTDWKQGWFYLENPAPALPTRTGRAPIPYPEWTKQLASRDTEELQPLLDDLK